MTSERRVSKDGIRQRARQRAFRRLAEMHPTDFERLHSEERAVEGLPPSDSAAWGDWHAKRPDIDTDTLVVEYLAGATSTALAADHDCSVQTVLNRLREAGVRMRRQGHPGWTQET